MDKISLKMTQADWIQLTAIVLAESAVAQRFTDKYARAVRIPLLKQVYIKLHNKLHSLKKANTLNLTLPEASVLCQSLQESDRCGIVVLSTIAHIDQKLT